MNRMILNKVRYYYRSKKFNCATTSLLILSEKYKINLSEQVIDSSVGMNGAGTYGAQCGLVEGALMFLGIIGKAKDISDIDIKCICKEFANAFENQFSSLQCSKLRPEGFSEDNPPHICEHLTCKAIEFNIDFLNNIY